MKSTRGWPLIAKGGYRELLDAQWDMGELPEDPEELRYICGASAEEWLIIWPKIEAKFPLNCSGRKNLRLEQHRQKAIVLYESRARGANSVNAQRDAQRTQSVRSPSRTAARPDIAQRDAQRTHPSPSPSLRSKNLTKGKKGYTECS